MSVSKLVKTALESIKIPVYTNVKDGSESEYIAITQAEETPEIYADDTDILGSTQFRVHLFTKLNPIQTKKTIRRLLRSAGVTITNTLEMYEADTKYTHIVIEAYTEDEIND